MTKINTVESALTVSYPGYFEMSVGEMDEYAHQLSPDPMELESQIMSDAMTDVTMDAILGTQAFSPSLDARSGAKVN
jgi:hypothetical protein